MKKLLFLLISFAAIQSFAQTKEKLQGVWMVQNSDSTSKQKMEIEFKFTKKEDWIIMRSKAKLSRNSTKYNVFINEINNYFGFSTTVNGVWNTITYNYSFLSDDILVLKNKGNPDEVMTLHRSK